MALLPVYRWAGLEDALTRRQQWGLNALGLVAAILGTHALGYIDLTAFSASVLAAQPGLTRPVVFGLAVLAAAAIGLTISEYGLMDARWVVAAAVGGFFLIDLTYVHAHVFENTPALMYWLAKPIWVGIPFFAVVWWLGNTTDVSQRMQYVYGAISGVISLQLYYTVIPIQMVGGESVQVGLVGNLTVGVPIHGLALLAALAVVVIGIQGRAVLGGGR